MVRRCHHLAQPPSWRTIPCWPSATAIQYIRSYPPYWRPFLHPQPEDAPCRSDRDPRITEFFYYNPQILKAPKNFNVMSICTLLVSCLNLSPFCLLNAVFVMAALDLISRFHLALFVIMLTKQPENFKHFRCF
jgi:hypothetical protein